MKLLITILILATILIAGCIETQEKIWVEKHLTQCAEEFGGPYIDNEDIKKFYEEKNIIIYDIKREEVEGQPCEACSCLSNTKLYLQISEKDKSHFLDQGYEQVESPNISTTTACKQDSDCFEKCPKCVDEPPLKTSCTPRFKCINETCDCKCICLS